MKNPQPDLDRLTTRVLAQHLASAPTADELEFIADLRQRSGRYAPDPTAVRAWTADDDIEARTLWFEVSLGLDKKWKAPDRGLYPDAGWQRACDDYESALADCSG